MFARRTASLLAAAVLAAAPSAAAAARHGHGSRRAHGAAHGCINADTPATAAPRQVIRKAVVCLINSQRASHGLPALHSRSRLDRSAQGWTNTMVASGQFTHGSDFAGRIAAAGYSWSFAGENIATGFQTPRAVV